MNSSLSMDIRGIVETRKNSIRARITPMPITAITTRGHIYIWNVAEIRYNEKSDDAEVNLGGPWIPLTNEGIAAWAAEEGVAWRMPIGRVLQPYEPLAGYVEMPVATEEVSIETVMKLLVDTQCLAPSEDTGELEITQHGLDVSAMIIRSKFEWYLEYDKWIMENIHPNAAMIRLLASFTKRAIEQQDDHALELLKVKPRPTGRLRKLETDVRPPLPIDSRL